MSKKLAGTTFIRNGIIFDYSFMETILGLLECCDHVFVVDAGSSDGTLETLRVIVSDKITLIERPNEEWESRQGTGKSKLCYFTDIAIQAAQEAGYEYHIYCQCDESIHEKSYANIREAIETNAPAYMITRVNLWASPYYQLDVSQDRLPCSNQIIRLAKTEYRSYGDAESLAVPLADSYFSSGIRMYHTGFVRKREIMKDKIKNMQQGVFEMADYDKKLDQCDVFNPYLWFSKEDLRLIDEPLPKLIQQWASERVYED